MLVDDVTVQQMIDMNKELNNKLEELRAENNILKDIQFLGTSALTIKERLVERKVLVVYLDETRWGYIKMDFIQPIVTSRVKDILSVLKGA